MIPIKIDDKNIAFRDLHFDKVSDSIQTLLIIRRDDFLTNSFEYKALDWIDWHLNLILKEDVNKLRKIITSFTFFVKSFISIIKLTIDDTITQTNLKQICRENKIKGFSKKNKTALISLINTSLPVSGKVINNLKYMNLSNKINLILKDIFEDFYKSKWDNIQGYNQYDFIKIHNINTCPYCNRNYISIVDRDKNKENGIRPDIDHFFPKSIYPYLAMSFYNLIPSCQVCNHTKSSKDTYKNKLLSPYEIDENTFKLTYKFNYINFLDKSYNTPNISVQFKNKDTKSEEYFKLETLYRGHQDIVLELLIKRTIYTKSYIKELKQNFRFTDDEIYRFLLCNYTKDEDLHKRPLSKLIKDISKELELIK